jgi:phage major head subunit gpT-like protein
MPWRSVAMQVNVSAKSTTLVDFGGIPYPTQNPQVVQDMIEKSRTVSPLDFYLNVSISQNAIDDDQTGTVQNKFRSVADAFERHINQRVFEVLNSGDGQTYDVCYDGQDFFDSDHVDDGAAYQTAQDNEFALALDLDNFETVWVAAQQFRDDQGKFVNHRFDQLVCHPSLYRTAVQVTGNQNAYDTANNEINPYSGLLKPPVVSPELDSTAWYLVASSESVKPMFVALRKRPSLIDMKFDGQQEDGGRHTFSYHGRYFVGFGDWRLAVQGNT